MIRLVLLTLLWLAPTALAGDEPEVAFEDSAAFDSALAEALASGADRVLVRFDPMLDPGVLPRRLGPWLAVHDQRGGTFSSASAQGLKTRGLSLKRVSQLARAYAPLVAPLHRDAPAYARAVFLQDSHRGMIAALRFERS